MVSCRTHEGLNAPSGLISSAACRTLQSMLQTAGHVLLCDWLLWTFSLQRPAAADSVRSLQGGGLLEPDVIESSVQVSCGRPALLTGLQFVRTEVVIFVVEVQISYFRSVQYLYQYTCLQSSVEFNISNYKTSQSFLPLRKHTLFLIYISIHNNVELLIIDCLVYKMSINRDSVYRETDSKCEGNCGSLKQWIY